MQQQVKQEIKQRIKNSPPPEALTAFLFSEVEYKNIDWLEENEFRLDGEMYDVARKKVDGKGNVILYVINDKKEKKLFIDLEEQAKENAQNSEEDAQETLNLFSNPIRKPIYFIPEKLILSPLKSQSSLLSFVREILPPPPKLT